MGKQFKGSPSDPLPLVIDKSAASTTALVVGVPGKVIRVYGIRLNVAGAVIVTLADGAGRLERFNYAAAGGGTTLDLREEPYYTTTVGADLNITLSAAVQVDGVVEYTIAK